MLDGIENGGLGNLVKHDAVGLRLVQTEHLAQVPGDGLSLTVLIGCEPYLLGLAGIGLQLANQFLFLFWNFVVGLQCVEVDTDLFLLQVADVTVTRHHLVVLPKELLNGLGLGWTLYNH